MPKHRWDEERPGAAWEQSGDNAEQRWQHKLTQARSTPPGGIKLGTSLATHLPVFITPDQLRTHMHVLGGTGVGKSFFLEGMIKKLILEGHGVCLIDPHGDLYHRVLDFCVYLNQAQPERHLERRLIPFNVAETKHILGFNPAARNARILTYQVVALMEAIRKCWGQGSFQETPRLARWLFNAAYAIINAELTLVQTKYLLDPKPSAYRSAITRRITDPDIRAEWEWISQIRDHDRNELTESSYNRIRLFVGHEIIKLIMGQQRQTIDFSSVLNEQKIVLVNLAQQNTIDQDYQQMLGTLLVNELVTAAFARPPQARKPFYLFIDEFQHFVTKDICEILDGGRKFGLHLILAHQHLNQLKQKDPEVYYSTLTNARIKAVFGGLIDEDLDILAKELYTGELDPDQIKDEIWQTKYKPVETTRLIRSTSETESTSESWGESSSDSFSSGDISHLSLSTGESYIPGSGLWTPSQLQSTTQTTSQGTGRSSASSRGSSSSSSSGSSYSSGSSEALVPWYEYHEFRELSSRTFRSLEEQLYLKKAQMKRQGTKHAAILIPGQPVQLVTAPTVKEFPITDRHREETKQVCFDAAGCFATPEQALNELHTLEETLLLESREMIEVQSRNDMPVEGETTLRQPRTRAKKPKQNPYDTIPPLANEDPSQGD